MKYKVWTRIPCYFDTLAEASAYASELEKESGNIVAITEFVDDGILYLNSKGETEGESFL